MIPKGVLYHMTNRNGVRAAVVAALCVLLCAAPVAAETTTATTTTVAAATTTTVAATTTTTTVATTTTTAAATTTVAATTTAAVATTTAAPTKGTTAANSTAAPSVNSTAKPTTKPTAKPAAKPAATGATTTVTGGTTQAGGDSALPTPLTLVDEWSAQTIDGVYYYNNGKKVSPNTFEWVAGHTGQAVALNGEDQYLRISAAEALALEEFTLSAWFNLRADTVGAKLLTVYKNESRFLTVSPHVQDTERGINGWYMEWQDRVGEPVTAFVPAAQGTTLAPAVGEWHHAAVVVSNTEFSLYLDGMRYLTQTVETDYSEIELSQFVVGGGFYGEPLLNALLDDVAVYPAALSAKQVAALANKTAQNNYYPTRPLADADRGVVGNVTQRLTVFGLPPALVILVGAVLVTVLVLSLVFSAQRKRQGTEEEHL